MKRPRSRGKLSVFSICFVALGSAFVACDGGGESNGNATPSEDAAGGSAGTNADAGGCSPACSASETCCDGQCIDTSSDVENCGECGKSCSAQNSMSTCTAGECVIESCQDGFVDCNQNSTDGCEATDEGLPGTPRPLSPVNGAYTGSVHAESSAMPLLRWLEPQNQGSCGALTYEIQVDDSCEIESGTECEFASPEAEGEGVTETSWKPGEPLPVQAAAPVGTVYFWRVRACEPGERCSDWSAARYLNVGRLRDDLNGDGYSDVLALSREGTVTDPRTFVIAGGAESFGPVEPVSLTSPVDFSADSRFIGDVNSDGFMDALRVDSTGATLLLGAADLAAITVVPIAETVVAALHAVAGLGDFDADGFADFAVSEYLPMGSTAEPVAVTRVYQGSAAVDLGAPLEVLPPDGTTLLEFGLNLEGGFDLNGDGYSDLAIMDGDDGRLHIVYGGTTTSPQIRASLQTGRPCVGYVAPERIARHALGVAGDVNGDGFADLAARCMDDVLVFAGGRTPELLPAWTSPIPGVNGIGLVGGYDLGQDGLTDLILHGNGATDTNLVLVAGAADLSSSATSIPFGGRFEGTPPNRGTGLTVGDHDGDGRADVLMHDFSGTLRWFSGGKIETSTEPCSQPESSFEQVGNWCEAATRAIEGSYATATNPSTTIGVSFGFVLAR